jgi:hypothetical protein
VYPFTCSVVAGFDLATEGRPARFGKAYSALRHLDVLQTQVPEATKRAGVAGFSVAIVLLWCERASTTRICEIPHHNIMSSHPNDRPTDLTDNCARSPMPCSMSALDRRARAAALSHPSSR